MKQKIQLIEQEVSSARQLVQVSEELSSDYDYLTGIAILEHAGQNAVLVSSSVAGRELLPKNFETLFISSGLSVAPDQRFFTLDDQQAAGNRIDLTFQDGGTLREYPYTLRIYLRLENKPETRSL